MYEQVTVTDDTRDRTMGRTFQVRVRLKIKADRAVRFLGSVAKAKGFSNVLIRRISCTRCTTCPCGKPTFRLSYFPVNS